MEIKDRINQFIKPALVEQMRALLLDEKLPLGSTIEIHGQSKYVLDIEELRIVYHASTRVTVVYTQFISFSTKNDRHKLVQKLGIANFESFLRLYFNQAQLDTNKAIKILYLHKFIPGPFTV